MRNYISNQRRTRLHEGVDPWADAVYNEVEDFKNVLNARNNRLGIHFTDANVADWGDGHSEAVGSLRVYVDKPIAYDYWKKYDMAGPDNTEMLDDLVEGIDSDLEVYGSYVESWEWNSGGNGSLDFSIKVYFPVYPDFDLEESRVRRARRAPVGRRSVRARRRYAR